MYWRVTEKELEFAFPAGTSRGVYTTHRVWYVELRDAQGRTGVGECAPLPDLSCDALPPAAYRTRLDQAAAETARTGRVPVESLRDFPSILMGLETAMLHLQRGSWQLGNSAFSRGEEGIRINGLVWMGDFPTMLQRLESKLAAGFSCIKIKIGAIGWQQELNLLRRIRERYGPQQVELRVDANGAFSPEEAPARLRQLAEFSLHSIEQPIRAGQWQAMARLCRHTPVPIALDEELIGINTPARKAELLDTVQPQYIILKPTLHGGFSGAGEWQELAEARGIRHWATSALESNVGLNAIAHWCGARAHTMPQGLGTGQIYKNNTTPFPLQIRGERLWFTPQAPAPAFPGAPPATAETRAALREFLEEWNSPAPAVTVHTSGSTGTPKQMQAPKKAMLASARMTCTFLGLQAGDSALLCLPLRYIAGKMMVVRALAAGLRLIPAEPGGHPMRGLEEVPDFAALVPLQVYNTLQVPEEEAILRRIRHVIIGGGAVDAALAARLRDFPNAVWSTYGMTETYSHIALRRLSGPAADDWYTPFPGVELAQDGHGCLIVTAPHLGCAGLVTRDIVEFDARGRFRILGRRDNTINSGGIKIQAEEVEALLHRHGLRGAHITAVPDAKFGECVVLLTTAAAAEAEALCRACLPPYWQPRRILHVPDLPLTPTGKPDRAAARRLAAQLAATHPL